MVENQQSLKKSESADIDVEMAYSDQNEPIVISGRRTRQKNYMSQQMVRIMEYAPESFKSPDHTQQAGETIINDSVQAMPNEDYETKQVDRYADGAVNDSGVALLEAVNHSKNGSPDQLRSDESIFK